MIVSGHQFSESVLHSESPVESSRFVAGSIEVTSLDRVSYEWGLQIMASVVCRVPFPIKRDNRTMKTTHSNRLRLPQLVKFIWLVLFPITAIGSVRVPDRHLALSPALSCLIFGKFLLLVQLFGQCLNLLVCLFLLLLLFSHFRAHLKDHFFDGLTIAI